MHGNDKDALPCRRWRSIIWQPNWGGEESLIYLFFFSLFTWSLMIFHWMFIKLRQYMHNDFQSNGETMANDEISKWRDVFKRKFDFVIKHFTAKMILCCLSSLWIFMLMKEVWSFVHGYAEHLVRVSVTLRTRGREFDVKSVWSFWQSQQGFFLIEFLL